MSLTYNNIKKFKDKIAREVQAITYDNRVLKDNGDFNSYQMNCNRLSGIHFVMGEFDNILERQESEERKNARKQEKKENKN